MILSVSAANPITRRGRRFHVRHRREDVGIFGQSQMRRAVPRCFLDLVGAGLCHPPVRDRGRKYATVGRQALLTAASISCAVSTLQC